MTTAVTRLLLLATVLVGLGGCSQILYRQTCVALAKDVSYCLAPLPLNQAAPKGQTSDTQAANGSKQPDEPQGSGSVQTQTLEQTLSLSQQVRLQRGEQSHELISQLELQPQQMTVVGLAPLGQALFTLIYDGHTLTSEQSVLLGNEFKAEYLLALLQLIYWPEEKLNAYLDGARVKLEDCAAVLCRVLLSNDNRELMRISYSSPDIWHAEVAMNMPQADLKLNIKPL
ncbi:MULTISPECIES: DUF3261 domain-containing protein [Shewanella]|uniref:DUF3261 domain-containing protein n=1 Tax=Shewanella TaxID=22 RepID=UPI001AAEC88F|nr:DUF3261 domain-containing protein [Shewanella algae]EKT4488531.1 DUF3261 domain-containing protein [Shewanella algae]MBO2550018.1 DUF3261 domain-containing protein [Shewanella algae]